MFRRLHKFTPPGIRIQLTLWYTVVSAALILIFGIAFYTAAQQLLALSFDTTLQLRSQQVAEGITIRNGKMTVNDVVNELPELDSTAALVDSFDKDSAPTNSEGDTSTQNVPRADRSILVRVLDVSGNVVYSTPTFNKLSVPDDSVAEPLKGEPWKGTIIGSGVQSIRLYSTMLTDHRHVVGVVQVGQSLAKLDTSLQHILLGLLLVTPFVLILSAFGSYWLAGRAFRPIHRLARTAHEISAKDLDQRVAVIRSMTELAVSQPSDAEDNLLVLREVNAESERLGRLINDLLALARADENQVKLDHEPVRLDLLAADVVESLDPLATERQITLRTQELNSATVLGDAARLIQIIMSLVDNALIYTNAGGCVTLSVKHDNSYAHLIVRHTGIGIAQKDIAHIFERFYRADPARSKAVGGSGLGLAIVDWLVRVHEGTISVESQPGQGSTFVVTLPLATQTPPGP